MPGNWLTSPYSQDGLLARGIERKTKWTTTFTLARCCFPPSASGHSPTAAITNSTTFPA